MTAPTIPETLSSQQRTALTRLAKAGGAEKATVPMLRSIWHAFGGRFKGVPEGELRLFAEQVARHYPVEGKPKPEPERKAEPKREESEPKRESAVSVDPNDLTQLAALLGKLSVSEERVRSIVTDVVGEALAGHEKVTRIEHVVKVQQNDRPEVEVEGAHEILAPVMGAISERVNVMLVGPAGSGKTTICKQIADALGLQAGMTGSFDHPSHITGYRDAHGRYEPTEFRRLFEEGGVFLFDEADSCPPEALTAVNAAIENDSFLFPDGLVQRHPDFVAIAAANTFGLGADRQYVGRYQLDAATLDRFATFYMDYDLQLERRIAAEAGDQNAGRWVDFVQNVRRAARDRDVRMVVSMRASINGAKLIKAGLDTKQVADAVLWKGVSKDERATIEAAL